MTIEELEKYRGIVADVKSLEIQLASSYYPVGSPNGRISVGTFNNEPGDPTRDAALRAMKIENDLSAMLAKQIDLLEHIAGWMSEIEQEDPELVAIIRLHYVCGLSWKQTNQKVYGYKSYYTARKKVFRYFGRE